MNPDGPPPFKRSDSETMMARLQWHEPAADTTLVILDRRRSRRRTLLEAAVTIWVPSEAGGGPHVDTTIIDVSMDGLGVLGVGPIAVGAVVAVQSSAGFAVGSVRRCEPHEGAYRWGIALEDCLATRATIESLIQTAKKLKLEEK